MDIQPISGIEELWKWKEKQGFDPTYFEELKNFKKKVNEPEVLVCHDMQGGYLEEERACGKQCEPNTYAYTFLNWWQIDIFNYFSHNFITIPPFSYTRIAHQHGCLSLGTFITEWIPGGKTCSRIFETDTTVDDTIDCLVAVARWYSFDGYLINIENQISPEKIELVLRFLRKLTTALKKVNEKSRIIWYDSVIENGDLKWQNELNHKNEKFYNACDGIYLNYNWTDQHLLNSSDFGKLHKIFVGIDVWARGCVGKLDCWKSFATAHLLHMSVALFAPGWIHETNPGKDQIQLGIMFWQKLTPYLKTRKLQQIGFETNFSAGMDDKWTFNLSKISLQSQFLNSTCHPDTQKGGLLLTGENTLFRLFTFDSINLPELQITVKSDHPITLLVNGTSHTPQTGHVHLKFNDPFYLKSVDILTKSHIQTTITHFQIK